MNKYNVNYSMACYTSGQCQIVVVNKRQGNDWLIAGYEQELKNTTEKNTEANIIEARIISQENILPQNQKVIQ